MHNIFAQTSALEAQPAVWLLILCERAIGMAPPALANQ